MHERLVFATQRPMLLMLAMLLFTCMWCTGRVDAYIKLDLDPSDVVECYDEQGRDIYLYPNSDLVIKDYMNPKFGFTG